MTSEALKTQIDSAITNKTATNSITPANVGINMKAVVDYIDEQFPVDLSGVVHTTGNEAITGIKSFDNTTLTAGLSFTNNNGSLNSINITNELIGSGLKIDNNYQGDAITLNNNDEGIALRIVQSLVASDDAVGISIEGGGLASRGIIIDYPGFNDAVAIGNSGDGNGILLTNSAAGQGIVSNGLTSSTGFVFIGQDNYSNTFTVTKEGDVKSKSFSISALNTAPASATATGITGEIRIDESYIYICTATNTWKRTALTTW